jgi:hypothetical protein
MGRRGPAAPTFSDDHVKFAAELPLAFPDYVDFSAKYDVFVTRSWSGGAGLVPV